MTALGFILTALAFAIALFESGKNREPFPGTAVLFISGISLMLIGITVFLWKHMP